MTALTAGDCRRICIEQLVRDYCVSPRELAGAGPLYALYEQRPGQRRYGGGIPFAMASVFGTAVFVSDSENMLDWCRKRFAGGGEWLCEAKTLFETEKMLCENGCTMRNIHHYYIPGAARRVRTDFEIVDIYKNELALLVSDDRFDEAIGGSEIAPDMMGCAFVDKNEILGLAAASADSDTMWQIGVNVVPEFRGRGVASALVAALSDRLLMNGIVPFYGTAESHIQSQTVAQRAGFVPAWWSAGAKRLSL